MIKTWARRTGQAGALAAGVLLFAGGVAQAAAPDMISAGNQGVGNGTQLLAPVQIPIDVCGNAIAVLGVAGAGCDGGSSANLGDDTWGGDMYAAPATESANAEDSAMGGGQALGDMVSAGNNGLLNGTQAQVPVQVPVDVCGNAVGALVGIAGAGCDGGSDANIGDTESAPVTEGLGDMVSAGNNGLLNGTQVQAPIQVPVDICGNGIAVAGVAGAGCDGGSSANLGDDTWGGDMYAAPSTESAPVTEGLGDMASAGNNGLLNGTQAQVPVQIPVDICGNAIAVLGVAGAGCDGGSSANIGDQTDWGYTGGDTEASMTLPNDLLNGVNGQNAQGDQQPAGADRVAAADDQRPAAGQSDSQAPASSNVAGLPVDQVAGQTAGALPTDQLLGQATSLLPLG